MREIDSTAATPRSGRRGRLARIAFWLGAWVLTLMLSVVLGLFAEKVLGIHYRWGLGLGIAIGVAVGESRRARRREAELQAPAA